jgi:hypothetical protein
MGKQRLAKCAPLACAGLSPRAPSSDSILVVVAGKMLAYDLHSVFGFHFVEKPSAAQ